MSAVDGGVSETCRGVRRFLLSVVSFSRIALLLLIHQVVLGSSYAAERQEKFSPTDAKKEMDSFVGQTGRTIQKEELGWMTEYRQSAGTGFGREWRNGYLVLKKKQYYGVLVGEMIPSTDVKTAPNQRKLLIQKFIHAELISDIPKEFVPSMHCHEKQALERCLKRESENKSAACVLYPMEILAFVKPRSRCGVDGDVVHSAYRYDPNKKQLVQMPVKQIVCNTEKHRPENCPVLVD